MPPRSSKSRSKKGKPTNSKKNKVEDTDGEERPEVTQDGEQAQDEPVAGDSAQETSHPSSEEIAPTTEEVVEAEPTEPPLQGMTMEERADKLKALRLKMVSSVSVHTFCG